MTWRKPPRRFLVCVDDTGLMQVINDLAREDELLVLLLTNKEELVGNAKIKGLICNNHETVDFKILK